MPRYRLVLTNTLFNHRKTMTLVAQSEQMAIREALGEDLFPVWDVESVSLTNSLNN